MNKTIRIRTTTVTTNGAKPVVNEYHDGNTLPEWFKPLQYIVEEQHFKDMTIKINGVEYLIASYAEDMDINETDIDTLDMHAIETAIQHLTGNILNLRTELMIVKAHVNTIAQHTNVMLDM